MASALGEAHSLLALLCQPAEVQAPVGLPPHVAVYGIDSGIRHSVGGSDYGSVRVGAFMGLRICSSRGEPLVREARARRGSCFGRGPGQAEGGDVAGRGTSHSWRSSRMLVQCLCMTSAASRPACMHTLPPHTSAHTQPHLHRPAPSADPPPFPRPRPGSFRRGLV